MLVGWGILSPLSKISDWAPGPVGDMNTGARGWILWSSLAIMCTDSIVSLSPIVLEWITTVVSRRRSRPDDYNCNQESQTEDKLVPYTWVVWGLITSVAVGILLVWAVFGSEGIKPWATFTGFVMGGVLSIFG
jgi:hypothetical protein